MRNIKEGLRIIDTLTGDLSTFRTSVKRRGGKAQILIHPFYTREQSGLAPSFTPPPEFNVLVKKFIEKCTNHNVPLIIFQEKYRMDELIENIKRIEGDIYVISTETNSPDPFRPHKWTELAAILEKAGIEQVTIGGLIFFVENANTNPYGKVIFPSDKRLPLEQAIRVFKEYEEQIAAAKGVPVTSLKAHRWIEKLQEGLMVKGCIGVAAIGFLQNGFDVSISPMTASENNLENPYKTLFLKKDVSQVPEPVSI